MARGTAVIYARFSCSKQREASIEDRLRVCRERCGREGCEAVNGYCDFAMSGRTDDRPRFQDMIARAGESDIVLAYMMDRFSRSEHDAPIYEKELAGHGVEVVSAMEALPDGPEKMLIEKIYEGLAAVESAKTAIRVKRGMTGNAMKRLHNGVRVYGCGVGEDGRCVVDEGEAAYVREACGRRAGGETHRSIARGFSARGVATATGRPCTPNMVEKILKSGKCLGECSWGGVAVPGGMPAIIGELAWERTRHVKARKDRPGEMRGKFAPTGRAVCGACGHLLGGSPGRGKGNVKCECCRCAHGDVRPVGRDRVESEMVAGVRPPRRRGAARASLQGAQTGIDDILTAIERGIFSDGVQERLMQLEDRKRAAERELASLAEREVGSSDPAAFLKSQGGMSDEAVLDAFVYRVIVTDEFVFVTLDYDAKNNEPARFDIERVRTVNGWRAISGSRRALFAMPDDRPGPRVEQGAVVGQVRQTLRSWSIPPVSRRFHPNG